MEECFSAGDNLAQVDSIVGLARKRRLYQFRVMLHSISPPIWRQIQVWEDATLAQLHRIVQVAMGWENYHLYEFRIGGRKYRDPHPDNERKILDAKRTRIRKVLGRAGAECEYLYDFGDGWQHDLHLEAVLEPDPNAWYPRCIAGQRSCPPEDVGGPGGYENYLEALADPNHKQHEEMMGWRGPFDPEAFSVEKVNRELKKKFRPVRKPAIQQRITASHGLSTKAEQLLQAILSSPVFPPRERIRVKPNETVPLELSERERELIVSHTFTDESLTNRLRVVPKSGQRPVFRFTLDDLDELACCVAFEANHAKDKKLQKELDRLVGRIQDTLDSYMDEDD